MKLTLGENKLVALDKVGKGVLGQLGNVGLALSFGEGGESGQEAGGKTLVLHDGLCGCLRTKLKEKRLRRYKKDKRGLGKMGLGEEWRRKREGLGIADGEGRFCKLR